LDKEIPDAALHTGLGPLREPQTRFDPTHRQSANRQPQLTTLVLRVTPVLGADGSTIRNASRGALPGATGLSERRSGSGSGGNIPGAAPASGLGLTRPARPNPAAWLINQRLPRRFAVFGHLPPSKREPAQPQFHFWGVILAAWTGAPRAALPEPVPALGETGPGPVRHAAVSAVRSGWRRPVQPACWVPGCRAISAGDDQPREAHLPERLLAYTRARERGADAEGGLPPTPSLLVLAILELVLSRSASRTRRKPLATGVYGGFRVNFADGRRSTLTGRKRTRR
jgi:hypothetical protein